MRNLNRHQVQFERQQERLAKAGELVATFIEQQGEPDILFFNDLYNFTVKNGHPLAGMLIDKNLRRMMAARGYEALRKPKGEKWSAGAFSTHTIFVRRSVPWEQWQALGLVALDARAQGDRTAAGPESRKGVDALLLQFFEEHGRPRVIFHRDLSTFAARRQEDERALNTKNFTLEPHGYAAVRNPNAAEWSKGKFRTRTAYVRDDVEVEDRAAVVREELENRG